MADNKVLRNILGILFFIGLTSLVGLLSFGGMFYLTSSVIASFVSTALAVIIEGEVYKQNVFSGVGAALHLGKYIEVDSYRNLLKKQANQKHLRQDSTLLEEYHTLTKRQKKLQSLWPWESSKKQRESLQKTERRLAEIEHDFFRYLNDQLDTSNEADLELEDAFHVIIPYLHRQDYLQSLQKNIKLERALLWLSMPVTLFGGMMAVFVTAAEITGALSLFGVSLTTTLMCAVVWPLAAIAAIGYMLVIYKTFIDIIHHKTIQNNWKSFKEKFFEGSTLTKILYTTGLVLIAGLVVAATICTAGTWWGAAQEGLALLPILLRASTAIKNVFIAVGMSLLGLSHAIFDFTNSLESFEAITSPASLSAVPQEKRAGVEAMSPGKRSLTLLGYKISTSYQNWCNKPLSVRCNPFTWFNMIVEKIFRVFVVAGHLISIGVTSDRLGDVNPAITATIGAAQEGVTDYNYIIGQDDHACHHDHEHSDIAGWCLTAVLAPTRCAAAAWNTAWDRLAGNKDSTFTEHLKNEFGGLKKHEHKHKHKHEQSEALNINTEMHTPLIAHQHSREPEKKLGERAFFDYPGYRFGNGKNTARHEPSIRDFFDSKNDISSFTLG